MFYGDFYNSFQSPTFIWFICVIVEKSLLLSGCETSNPYGIICLYMFMYIQVGSSQKSYWSVWVVLSIQSISDCSMIDQNRLPVNIPQNPTTSTLHIFIRKSGSSIQPDFIFCANNSSTSFLQLFTYLDKLQFIFYFVSVQNLDIYLSRVTYGEEKVNRKFYRLKDLVLFKTPGPQLPDLFIDCVF